MAAAASTSFSSTTTFSAALRFHPLHHHHHTHTHPTPLSLRLPRRHLPSQTTLTPLSFQRSDFDGFTNWAKSPETWKDAWRNANDGFERLVFESRKAAERLDRRYKVSVRVAEAARGVGERARVIDRKLEVSRRWREVEMDFKTNFPRYRRQVGDFLNTPLGRGFTTIFFLWFALSGWMFRVLFFATFFLPLAGPFAFSAVANKFVVQGACPSCKKEFIGYKSQIISCRGCGNIVWQPNNDPFGKSNKGDGKSKPPQQIIDVEYEER
ncbi:hypothetical protein AKJ16_DCAP19043 [Drosera capensis]